MEQDETLSALSDILAQVPSQNAIQEFGTIVDLRESGIASFHISHVSAGVFETFTRLLSIDPIIRDVTLLRSLVQRADKAISMYLELVPDADRVHGIHGFNEMLLWAIKEHEEAMYGWALMFPSEHL